VPDRDTKRFWLTRKCGGGTGFQPVSARGFAARVPVPHGGRRPLPHTSSDSCSVELAGKRGVPKGVVEHEGSLRASHCRECRIQGACLIARAASLCGCRLRRTGPEPPPSRAAATRAFPVEERAAHGPKLVSLSHNGSKATWSQQSPRNGVPPRLLQKYALRPSSSLQPSCPD
jgi:hypothetical protein